MKGSIIASADLTGSSGTVDALTFQVSNAAAGEAIDLTVGATIIKYSDSEQTLNLDTVGEFTIDGTLGSADGDNFLERGEVFEISIPTATMTALREGWDIGGGQIEQQTLE